ncbi:MAG: hypothetical protein PVH54_09540 [Gammaproteobacteria bacterium]
MDAPEKDNVDCRAPDGRLPLPCCAMKDLLILLVRLLTTIASPPEPGALKTLLADSLLMKQQLLLILGRQGHTVRLIASIPHGEHRESHTPQEHPPGIIDPLLDLDDHRRHLAC